ncbi:MAG: CRISPR-associated endonuclease Cas2 [Salinivirgaceae bacterium]|nr:CRISPR-associated endonuclease Cas2 [Salinivirgaceae bacterium]
MLVISYDISNDKLHTQFMKMIKKHGAIRLQYSVYELNNTKRVKDIMKVQIESRFAKQFDGGDSIFVFETDSQTAVKYGNAIHRDQDMLFFT